MLCNKRSLSSSLSWLNVVNRGIRLGESSIHDELSVLDLSVMWACDVRRLALVVDVAVGSS